jgi:non-heme chloroperoxidase
MAYLELKDGTPLYYIDKGEGRPFLMVNALMFTADYYWRKNIDAIASGNRLIFPDMRGQGQSGKPNSGFTIKQLADDIEDICEQLGLDDIVLGGLALGAIAVLDYYKRYGSKRLSKIVLMDFTPRLVSAPDWDHPTFGDFPEEMANGYAGAVRADRSVLKDFIKGSFAEPPSDDEFLRLWAQSYLTPTDICADFIEDMVKADYRDVVPTIKEQTLLIYGGPKNHTLPTAIGPWMKSQIANSELAVFEESGHCPFIEEPDKFNDVLGDFIRS